MKAYEDLKVGDRVKSQTVRHGLLTGTITGFQDLVDLDAMDDGATEEEATVTSGLFHIALDPKCYYEIRLDSGTKTVKTASCDYEQWDEGWWEPA